MVDEVWTVTPYFFLGPLLTIGGLGADLVRLPPRFDTSASFHLLPAAEDECLAAIAAGESGISRHRKTAPFEVAKQLGGWPGPSKKYRAPSKNVRFGQLSCGTGRPAT